MNGIGTIKEAVELALISGYVEGDQPASLLITAEVEEGKTHLVSQYANQPGVAYLSDATAWGILETYQDDLEKGKLKHLIFPEFIRPLERNKESASSLIAFLAELTEEGVKEIRTYATDFQLPNPVKAGVIACTARGNLKLRLPYWNPSGFLSRFLVMSYTYGPVTEENVRRSIMAGQPSTQPELTLPAPAQVKLPKAIGEKIGRLSKDLAQSIYAPLHGYRVQKQLNRLVKASALREGRYEVTAQDLDRIEDIARYCNLKYTQI